MRTKRTNSRTTTKKTTKTKHLPKERAPLVEHLHELKRRLIYVAIAIVSMTVVVYSFERQLIDILLRPSHGQHFVYTSPMGGINFLFSVCFSFGIALSAPIIVYQLLKFLQPVMRGATQHFIVVSSVVSGLIAICGILFGYYAGLPAALHFLLRQQFQNGQVEALISIQNYFSFVVAYMFGAALMFQLPLLLVIINRIKQLNPKKMLSYERGVVIFAVIAAFIMNPTPNLIDQMLTVVPVIITYQLGILIVWLINRGTTSRRYSKLFDQDAAARADRLAKAREAVLLPTPRLAMEAPEPAESFSAAVPAPQSVHAASPVPAARPSRAVSARYVGQRPDYGATRGQLVQF